MTIASLFECCREALSFSTSDAAHFAAGLIAGMAASLALSLRLRAKAARKGRDTAVETLAGARREVVSELRAIEERLRRNAEPIWMVGEDRTECKPAA